MKTTLAAIRKAHPCSEGWPKLYKSLGGVKKFGLHTEFSVSHIVNSNGLNDALWVLAYACGKEGETLCHLFACDVAERVLHLFEAKHSTDKRPRDAIKAKRKWTLGEISREELTAARDAAWDAARAAAWDATRDAAWAVARAAAGDAAWDAAWDAARYAAWAAAGDAAGDATRAAAWAAAWDAAWAAECEWQSAHLIEMLENME